MDSTGKKTIRTCFFSYFFTITSPLKKHPETWPLCNIKKSQHRKTKSAPKLRQEEQGCKRINDRCQRDHQKMD